jgi:hypothetical protein
MQGTPQYRAWWRSSVLEAVASPVQGPELDSLAPQNKQTKPLSNKALTFTMLLPTRTRMTMQSHPFSSITPLQ